jgi:hypothetical protein
VVHGPYRKLKGEVIAQDRACAKCGYSLRGLRPGGHCPECGTPILASQTDPLAGWVITDAGGEYLRDLGFASVLTAMCAGPILLGVIWTLVELPWPKGLTLWPGGGAAVASVGWVLGVWFMTQPRPTPSGSGAMTGEWTGARWTARVTQLAWVLGIPMAVWGANEIAEFNVNGTAPDPLANAAVVTGMLLWLVGFFGLGAVALYMARLADWAMDTGLSERLRLVPYAIGIGGFLIAFLVLLRGPIGYQGGGLATMFMGGLGLLLLLIAITQFAMAVFSFANLARWSASSRRAKIDSAARRSRRILERVEGGLAKPESTAASAHHAGQARVQGKVIERSGESNPYDLA